MRVGASTTAAVFCVESASPLLFQQSSLKNRIHEQSLPCQFHAFISFCPQRRSHLKIDLSNSYSFNYTHNFKKDTCFDEGVCIVGVKCYCLILNELLQFNICKSESQHLNIKTGFRVLISMFKISRLGSSNIALPSNLNI